MRARQIFDTEHWTLADRWTHDATAFAAVPRAEYAFTNAFAALQRGNASLARAFVAGPEPSDPAIRLYRQELRGLLAIADGRTDDGLRELRAAADAEDALPFEFGPPAIVKPTAELLGQQLLKAGRTADAHAAFNRAAQRTPGRALVVAGLKATEGAAATAAQAPGGQNPAPSLPACTELAAAVRGAAANDARLRDWPNLARYRDANRDAAAVDVVFLGDSITDSWQQPRFGGFFPGRRYADRGISGQTTPQMLVRFRPDVIALHPKAVVILGGTNDIAGNTGPMTDEQIEGNIESMSELAAAGHIKVVLASVLPTGQYHVANPNATPQTTLRPMDRIRAINAWMRKYASAHGHVYLDYFSSMIDSDGLFKAELSLDDLHPNAAGYAVMAPLAQAAIDAALR